MPQLKCGSCGTGYYLSLRTRLIAFAIGFPTVVGAILALRYAKPYLRSINAEIFTEHHLGLFAGVLALVLFVFCWWVVVRRYAIWLRWHPGCRYHLF